MTIIRFLISQYRLSCRIGFGPRKAIHRAIRAYLRGF